MPRPNFPADGPGRSQSKSGAAERVNTARTPDARDHVERAPDRLLASVTDRGKSYPKNQDDVRVRSTVVESSRVSILVVCDGVSSGQNADVASQIAATTATDSLLTHLALGGDLREAMRQSILAADHAVRQIDYSSSSRTDVPPGSTIVAAIAMRKRLVVGWIGDSRCYLIDKTGAKLLTHDHSWVNEVVDNGIMSHADAVRSPEAHQISRCIGPLHGNRVSDVAEPGIIVTNLPDSGVVLLCSDGLWNYAPAASQIAALVKVGPGAPDAITQARSLVDFALAQGGKDNVSVAVMVK